MAVFARSIDLGSQGPSECRERVVYLLKTRVNDCSAHASAERPVEELAMELGLKHVHTDVRV